MKKLFVAHTQYNLILSIALSQDNRNDDLILFKDFSLTDVVKDKLESRFCRCLYLDGAYPKKEHSGKEKLSIIDSAISSISSFIDSKYDQVFIIEDMCIPEMYAMKCAFKRNPSVEFSWLEDGANAYFSNSSISMGMGSTPFKRMIRKMFFTIRYGLYGFYDLAKCMGAHKKITSAYLLFPQYIRKELKDKRTVEITLQQFKNGMDYLYKSDPYKFEEDSILIAMDKLSVYDEKLELVNEAIQKIVDVAIENKKKVYCKYHPRETDKLPALIEAQEIDSKIALEFYLTNSSTTNIMIVGIKSTVLQNAKKLGFNTMSLVSITDGKRSSIVDFYDKIGIKTF